MRSPPARSHSASSTGRGHTAASAMDAVVTPGDPLSAATAISAMTYPADPDFPPLGRIATPTEPLEALHATGPASAGLSATTTLSAAPLPDEAAGTAIATTTAFLVSAMPGLPGQLPEAPATS